MIQEKAQPQARASPLREVTEEFRLEERTVGDKTHLVVKATVARAGIINRNRRFYGREVFERAVAAAQEELQNGGLVGLLNHPEWDEPLKGRPEKIAVKWTALDLEGDDVKAEGLIVKTTSGREVEALADAKVKLGISTNGVGSAKFQRAKELVPDPDDPDELIQVIQDDYRFLTIDVVNDPSNIYGSLSREQTEESMTLEELKAKHPALYEQVRAEGEAAAKPDTELKTLEQRLVALEAENKALKAERERQERVAAVEAAIADAKLPKLGKSGEIDLDGRFRKQLEQAAIAAESLDAAEAEVAAMIAERKALIGQAENNPGIKRKEEHKPQGFAGVEGARAAIGL